MMFRVAVLSALLLLLLHGTSLADNEVLLPSCPRMTEATVPKYHQTCNREAQNSNHRRRQRIAQHELLEQRGAYPLIPTQRTIVCPIEPIDLSSSSGGIVGQDSRWIVENASSGRVVVAFVKNGMEYSATNPSLTPPQRDVDAILQPGEFKVIHTFEGHVFHVRELLEDGSVGNVLLQHRPGVVEFQNDSGQELAELVNDEKNDESVQDDYVFVHDTPSPKEQQEQSTTRTMPNTTKLRSRRNLNERCNMVYQGFRNTVGVPLDVYYAGVGATPIHGPMQCHERFKFHLGFEEKNVVDWNSTLKYEATMVGHAFVARLASDPNVVVDTFVLQPTQIQDCPRRQHTLVQVEQVMIEFDGIQHGTAHLSNSTREESNGMDTARLCSNASSSSSGAAFSNVQSL
jgi:hypothetical protein